MNRKDEYFRNKQYPDDKFRTHIKNVPLSQLIDLNEEIDIINYWDSHEWREEKHHIFEQFLERLREKGIPVSPPEWMHFLSIVKVKAKDQHNLTLWHFFELLRIYAKTTLIKDKAYEKLFHEVFDEYFMWIRQLFIMELEGKIKLRNEQIKQSKQQELINVILSGKLMENKEKIKSQLENNMNAERKDSNKQNKEGKNNDENSNKNEEVKNIKDSEKTEGEWSKETNDDGIKKQLWIKNVDENVKSDDKEHDDTEQQHGWKDQHNDILKKQDDTKLWGWNKKDLRMTNKEWKGDKNQKNKEICQENENFEWGGNQKQKNKNLRQENEDFIWGGNQKLTKSVNKTEKIYLSPPKTEIIKKLKESAKKYDVRNRYEKRPDKMSMREVIRSLRKIIIRTSEVKSNQLDVKQSVKHISKKNYTFEYSHEKKRQQELVLFIDVWGPVDEWRPIIDEVTESMTKWLSKLEVYLFHNNLYGYVWPYDKKKPSNYAPVNGLVNIKDIVKHRKKTIIYWDAEMAKYEIDEDGYPPNNNEKKIDQYEMSWIECLNYIKKKSKSVVWLNPIFKKEREFRDNSWSIKTIKDVIPMYDLTVGGIEDAIKFLIKKG